MKTKFNQSKLKLAIVSAIMACSAGLSASSYAATTTATMTVTSSVATACTMATGDWRSVPMIRQGQMLMVLPR